MLLQFAVENFRSIADKVVLSFLAVEGEEHPEGQVVQVPGVGGVLRSVVIYGPNASGKSTVVEAFGALRRLAVDGVVAGRKPFWQAHRLDPERLAAPTIFETELWCDGVRYAYGLSYSAERVLEEWLIRRHMDGDLQVFEREPDNTIVLGEGLAVDESRRSFYGFVAEGTRPEQPFLAELRQRNAVELTPLFKFFERMLIDRASWDPDEEMFDRIFAQWPHARRSHAALLKEAGTGVTKIDVFSSDPELRRKLRKGLNDDEAEAAVATKGALLTMFMHQGREIEAPLAFHELSDGTRRLLWLAQDIEFGDYASVVCIDELDRSLHTQLAKYVIERLNATGSRRQFVLTTHDTNLLDAGVFGRDAIWFCEKDGVGATHLYSLVEFDRGQLDQLTGHLEEGYLMGRFGALPFSVSPSKLGWIKQ
jgi:energy-coupling factor transporter ATP-binding protein EcfA2